MAQLTEPAVLEALRRVNDPELQQDLVSLGMVEQVTIDGDSVTIKMNLLTPAYPFKENIRTGIRSALGNLEGIRQIDITFDAPARTPQQEPLPGVKNIVAVGSGKGGVGKSTIAANLAASLVLEGFMAGLLDADIYGPSQAKMFAVEGKRLMANEEKNILPLKSCGVKLISIANLVEDGQALTWRGPILHGTLTQLLQQTAWGELDYLIVDLPPGTGDVQLSLSQLVPLAGAIMVTTPQDVALLDVKRAYSMFRKVHVPVLGVVENMSYYQLPDGSRDYLFGQGGAEVFAGEETIALLGQIPLTRSLRESSDAGKPLVLADPESASAQELRKMTRLLVGHVRVQAMMTLPVV